MKVCRRCQQEKSFTEFRPDPRYRGGYGSWCIDCHRQRSTNWAKENKELARLKAAKWRAENAQKVLEINRRFHNKWRDKRAAYSAMWTRANRDKRRATTAKRNAALRRAIPGWANESAMRAIYAEALRAQKQTGERYHVDHIVPLQSPIVCGLHCEANLRILPGAENESKRNFWWPDMPEIDNAQRQGRLIA